MSSQYPEIVPRLESYSMMRTWRERHGRYRLVGSQCKSCGEKWFPRREGLNCPHCKGIELEPYECAHTGVVEQLQIENMGYPVMGYGDWAPRMIVTILLDDGITVLSEIVDASPEEVHKGSRVKMVLRKHKREETGGWMYGFMFTLIRE
jgi:uncharacterized OB-fold protein